METLTLYISRTNRSLKDENDQAWTLGTRKTVELISVRCIHDVMDEEKENIH